MADGVNVGDTVALNSGGPPMAVVEVTTTEADQSTKIVAWWRAADKTPQIIEIDTRCVTLVGRNDPIQYAANDESGFETTVRSYANFVTPPVGVIDVGER